VYLLTVASRRVVIVLKSEWYTFDQPSSAGKGLFFLWSLEKQQTVLLQQKQQFTAAVVIVVAAVIVAAAAIHQNPPVDKDHLHVRNGILWHQPNRHDSTFRIPWKTVIGVVKVMG
jgi:hypothetical protein